MREPENREYRPPVYVLIMVALMTVCLLAAAADVLEKAETRRQQILEQTND